MITQTSDTTKIETTCGHLYVTITYNEHGKHSQVFISMGKAGNCSNCHFQAVARMVSYAFELGGSYMGISNQLKHLACPEPFTISGKKYKSCYDAISELFEEKRELADKEAEEKNDETQKK